MTTDNFQQQVLQRLSVIETQTRRVLDDVEEVDKRVVFLEAEHNKQYGAKAALGAIVLMCVDAIAHFWNTR